MLSNAIRKSQEVRPIAEKPAKIDIYTDGACSGNPGPGGYGAVLVHGKRRKEFSGGFRLTTTNETMSKARTRASFFFTVLTFQG